jgi:hypothetical protein
MIGNSEISKDAGTPRVYHPNPTKNVVPRTA